MQLNNHANINKFLDFLQTVWISTSASESHRCDAHDQVIILSHHHSEELYQRSVIPPKRYSGEELFQRSVMIINYLPPGKKKPRHNWTGLIKRLAMTYSPGAYPVPSALAGLTTLFGMGRGGRCRYNHLKDGLLLFVLCSLFVVIKDDTFAIQLLPSNL